MHHPGIAAFCDVAVPDCPAAPRKGGARRLIDCGIGHRKSLPCFCLQPFQIQYRYDLREGATVCRRLLDHVLVILCLHVHLIFQRWILCEVCEIQRLIPGGDIALYPAVLIPCDMPYGIVFLIE